jgi:hypothetical protein
MFWSFASIDTTSGNYPDTHVSTFNEQYFTAIVIKQNSSNAAFKLGFR